MDDHRKLGRELGLFDTDPLIGAGLPYWLPAGAAVRHALEEYLRELERRAGYQHVYSPVLGKRELYEISGHWSHYRDGMYPPMEVGRGAGRAAAQPVPAPRADLPVPRAELPRAAAPAGRAGRPVPDRALRGARRADQGAGDAAERRAHLLHPGPGRGRGPRGAGDDPAGLRRARHRAGPVPAVAARPGAGKYVGDPRIWDQAAAMLAGILDDSGLPWEAGEGEAAFYGPKIDVQVADAAEREATLSTVQVDFYQPDRFGLQYTGADGERHRPVMVHRSVVGSMERVVAHLIERHGGAFPDWLAPEQLVVLPVADAQDEAAAEVARQAAGLGLRARVAGPDRAP